MPKLRKSLRFRLLMLALIFVISIAALLIYNYMNTVDTIHNETYLAVDSISSLYSRKASESLHSIELQLVDYTNDIADINTIKEDKRRTIEWYISARRIQRKFSSDTSLHPVNGFFLFSPGSNLFMTNETTTTMIPKQEIIESLSNGEWTSPEEKGKWILLVNQDAVYIYRAISIGGCYIGTWINAPAFIADFTNDSDVGVFGLIDENGNLLDLSASVSIEGFPADDNGYMFVDMDNASQMMIYKKLSFANLWLSTLVDNEMLERSIKSYIPIAVFVILGVAVILLLTIIAMRRWIFTPVNNLSAAIKKFRKGDWSITIENDQSCTEFQEVNSAFNKMISEIQGLKIDIYEEQLKKQNIEMEYLKLQITPHFIINCLNTISQLKDADKPELEHEMITELSHHLRYALSAGPIVTLSAELEHVRNYVALSNIRYNNSIILHEDIDAETLNCHVVPLLLCNFIENTVKHEVKANEETSIYLYSELVVDSGSKKVVFRIKDTGTGFPERLLSRLQSIEQYVELNRSRHIGISNVYKRAILLLGECEFIFSNSADGGAEIRITIPADFSPLEGEIQ